MGNPFCIKPGEVLKLSSVLNRFFDWDEWNRAQTPSRSAIKDGCHRQLYFMGLCCEDHMAMMAEHDAFYRYLECALLVIVNRETFTPEFLKNLIRSRKLQIDESRAWKFFGYSEEMWNRIGEEPVCLLNE